MSGFVVAIVGIICGTGYLSFRAWLRHGGSDPTAKRVLELERRLAELEGRQGGDLERRIEVLEEIVTTDGLPGTLDDGLS